MLTQKAKYALRACIHLAARPGETPRIAEIGAAERIPPKFLEAILLDLRKGGVLESVRGRKGGYRLARPAAMVSMGDVIRLIDGSLAPIRCASRQNFEPCQDCADVNGCVIRWAMLKARDAMATVLDRCTLAEAAARRSASDDPLDFVI